MPIGFNLRTLCSTCSLCFQSRSLQTTVRGWLDSFPCLCFRSTQWALSMSMSIPSLVLTESFTFSSASSQVLREDSRIPLTLMLLRRLWLSIYSSESDWDDRSELSRLLSLFRVCRGGVFIPHSRPVFARIPHPVRFSSVSRIPIFFPRKIY